MPAQPHTRVLHIDVTGNDHAGVTHSLTSILARSGARILDIGQAVIHDSLALGMLIELTDEMKSSSLLTELLLKAHELGVRIHFTAISDDEYEAWVRAQAKGRYIISDSTPRRPEPSAARGVRPESRSIRSIFRPTPAITPLTAHGRRRAAHRHVAEAGLQDRDSVGRLHVHGTRTAAPPRDRLSARERT